MTLITGTAGLPDGTVYALATFTFSRSPYRVNSQGGMLVTPKPVSTTSDINGAVRFSLLPGKYTGFEATTRRDFEFEVPDADQVDWTVCVLPAAPGLLPTELAAAHVTMSGGGTAQDYAGFASYADLVRWAVGKVPAVGVVVEAEGIRYRYDGASSEITDLPGWTVVTTAVAQITGLPAVALSGRWVDLTERPTTLTGAGITDAGTLAQQVANTAGIASSVARLSALESIGASGTSPREVAAVATTGNITLSGEQTINGVTTSASRVAVLGQSSGATVSRVLGGITLTNSPQNGIYVSGAGAWARAADMNSATEFLRASVYVTGGTLGAGATWFCPSTVATVGTDPVEFTQMSSTAGFQSQIDTTNTRTGGVEQAATEPFMSFVDGNGVKYFGFDSEASAVLYLSPQSIQAIFDWFAENKGYADHDGDFFEVLDATRTVKMFGLDADGAVQMVVSQDVANQVAALLDLSAGFDPQTSGLLPKTDIFMLGDSMTTPSVLSGISAGLGGRATAILQHGGLFANMMATAFGAIPLTVTLTGNTIPASGGVTIPPGNYSAQILSNGGTPTGTANVTIAGIPGVLTTDGAAVWTFTRTTPGAAVSVSANVLATLNPDVGTDFTPATGAHRDKTAVIWLGRNGYRTTRAQRKASIDAIVACIDWLTPRIKRVLVLSVYNKRAVAVAVDGVPEPMGSAEYDGIITFNAELARAVGDAYVDMRGWAVRNAIYDMGLTPTADDLADMALDCIPRQLFASGDDTHVTTAMQTAQGRFIADVLKSKGW